jgi:hypothetical protein
MSDRIVSHSATEYNFQFNLPEDSEQKRARVIAYANSHGLTLCGPGFFTIYRADGSKTGETHVVLAKCCAGEEEARNAWEALMEANF